MRSYNSQEENIKPVFLIKNQCYSLIEDVSEELRVRFPSYRFGIKGTKDTGWSIYLLNIGNEMVARCWCEGYIAAREIVRKALLSRDPKAIERLLQ